MRPAIHLRRLAIAVCVISVGVAAYSPVTTIAEDPPAVEKLTVNTRNTSAMVSWQLQSETSVAEVSDDFIVEVDAAGDFSNAVRKVSQTKQVILSDLDPQTTYFARIRVGEEGAPSEPIAFTTGEPIFSLAPPVVTLKAKAARSISASWKSDAAEDASYEVQYSTQAQFSDLVIPRDEEAETIPGPELSIATPSDEAVDQAEAEQQTTEPTTLVVDKPKLTLKDLEKKTTYYFRVRVLDTESKPASEWSDVADAKTVESLPLEVASYNVKCVKCGGTSWAARKEAVAKTILGETPDVVGIQEASQARSTGPQFDQLINLLGDPYKGSTQRVTGATDGFIYNSDTVEVISEGSEPLEQGKSDRRLAWAIFRQKSTDKLFVFGSVHLEPNNGKKAAARRIRQAKEVVSTLKALAAEKDLPIIVVGDFNTYYKKSGGNGAYKVMTNTFLDPLGKGSNPGVAKPAKKIGTRYNSMNHYRRTPPKKSVYIDYIFVTPMKVSVWETVVNVNSKGKFVGTIPSDHNMIKATVYLP